MGSYIVVGKHHRRSSAAEGDVIFEIGDEIDPTENELLKMPHRFEEIENGEAADDDVLALSIPKLKKAVAEIDDIELLFLLLRDENADKNRNGAIKAIDRRISVLEEEGE